MQRAPLDAARGKQRGTQRNLKILNHEDTKTQRHKEFHRPSANSGRLFLLEAPIVITGEDGRSIGFDWKGVGNGIEFGGNGD